MVSMEFGRKFSFACLTYLCPLIFKINLSLDLDKCIGLFFSCQRSYFITFSLEFSFYTILIHPNLCFLLVLKNQFSL